MPDAWQGNLLTNDFRGNRVCRFVLSDDGAGFAARQQSELIKTSHVAFRPIDIKMGPDGAIYIADWYNPIIQHGEVDFRDPRRDHTRGRIWRVTAKGRPLVTRPRLVGAPAKELLDSLKAPEQWTRQQARRVIQERGKSEFVAPLREWTNALDTRGPRLRAPSPRSPLDLSGPRSPRAWYCSERSCTRPTHGSAPRLCGSSRTGAAGYPIRSPSWVSGSPTNIRASGSRRCGPWPSSRA